MSSNSIMMQQIFPVAAGDFVSAGEVSGRIKKLLKQLGIDSGIIRRTAIASYEIELNLVIHSHGGQITFAVNPQEILITAEDTGPGIPDIELAMREGYSTASEKVRELGFGAGMGLPNIKRCSDNIEIYSQVGQGTRVDVSIKL